MLSRGPFPLDEGVPGGCSIASAAHLEEAADCHRSDVMHVLRRCSEVEVLTVIALVLCSSCLLCTLLPVYPASCTLGSVQCL